MLHKVFNDKTPEILSSEISDFLKQNFSSLLISCLKPFFHIFAFIREGLNINLAQDIFGKHEKNYWGLWIQRVPDSGDNLINRRQKNGLFD